MSLSNYPPGFGSGNDWDHVGGPLAEEEVEGDCPKCGVGEVLVINTWRASEPTINCGNCDWGDSDESKERLLELVQTEL